MQPSSSFRPSRYLCFRPLLTAITLLALSCALREARGQVTIGHQAAANKTTAQSDDAFPFVTGLTSDTLIVIPFSFNSVGSYTLAETRLLLRDGSSSYLLGGEGPAEGSNPNTSGSFSGGGGASGTGDTGANSPSFSGVSINVFSTLPTSSAVPTSLLSFSTAHIGGPSWNAFHFYHYSADAAPTFTGGVTYYLGITYVGTGILEWDLNFDDHYNLPYPGDIPLTSIVGNSDPLVFYKVTAAGVENFYDNVGGFSITANVVSAIPEPAAVAVLAASSVLALALFVRWRRRHTTVSAEP